MHNRSVHVLFVQKNASADVTCPETPDANFTTQNTTIALYGTNVKYTCFYGYHVPGTGARNVTEQVITCEDTGSWSKSPHSCESK